LIKSLVKRADFVVLQREGQKVKKGSIQLQFLSSLNDEGKNNVRIGYAISRNVGSAVFRNKIRRQLREIVNQIYKDNKNFPKGSYLIRVFPGIKGKSFSEINTFFKEAIDELKKNEN
tara:strand:+ start:1082 stop:1432 length:351 start_codon:yes stop_codon:yes gene_type:complete